MNRRKPSLLASLVESFFLKYLQQVRGASPHTVRSYRDTLRLLFQYLVETKQRPVARLTLEDLNVESISSFLEHLQRQRGNGPATRNCRLAAIHGFVMHLLNHDPVHAEQYQRVLSLPLRRARPRLASYLEPEHVRAILSQPNRRTASGVRDYALLLLLYNTGARVSEALAIRWTDLELKRPRQVRLHGKGRKERICPLWRETTDMLKRLATSCRFPAANEIVFRNARGEPLTRDGVAYILRKHASAAARVLSDLRGKKLSPHVLRHSCAVALLQAGVDVTVIRDYLGHASIATTNHYVTSNLQMKRDVLEVFWKRAGLTSSRTKPWQPSSDLLTFLDSL